MSASSRPATGRFVADPSVDVHYDGRVLLGGSPLRVVRLTGPGAEVARQVLDGEPVPTGRAASALVRRLLDGGLVHPVPDSASHSAPTTSPSWCPCTASCRPSCSTASARWPPWWWSTTPARCPSPSPIAPPHGTPVRVIRRAAQGGPGAARNTGLAEVTTPLVAFVDADCVPVPGWLDRLLPHLDDPDVAVVAPRIVPRRARRRRRAARPLRGRVRSALDIGHRAGTGAGPLPGLLRALGRAARPRRRPARHRRLRRRRCPSARTSTWSGASTRRAAPSATSRPPPSPTATAPPSARGPAGASTTAPRPGPSPCATPAPSSRSRPRRGAWPAGASPRPGPPVRRARLRRSHASPCSCAASTTSTRPPGSPPRSPAGATSPSGACSPTHWCDRGGRSPSSSPWRCRRSACGGPCSSASSCRRSSSGPASTPATGPISYVGLRLADDVAYSTGVWVGAFRARTAEPLLPDLTSWPKPGRYTTWRTAKAAAGRTATADGST